MAENNQPSDETKNNSTDTSSTDASSAVIGNHENAVVPHKISNHDKLVQTMVMVDGEWINVNDTNDQANMKEDMHKVNKKVVEAEKGIVEAKNTADSAVKYADSAVSASKVNSDALVAQSSAISEAKAAAHDAASKAQFIKENASSEAAAIRNQVADVANNVSSVKADVASAASDIANLKVDVQTNSTAIIKTNEAVSVQSKSSSDAINELKIANGQVESIAKDAKNNATVAKQTADTATTLAQDAKSNAVLATQTATSATVEATNATSTATKAELSVNGLTTRVTAIEGNNKKLSNQITSTETIIQQTKDQLLQKADKSVVDQANNLISQLSAEQKTMAGQISQKVSSSEYQTLRDKVNRMKVGTRNLLHDTSDQYRTLTGDGWMGVHTSSDEYTSVASYHNGNLFTYAATISNTSDVPVELQVWRCDQNKNRLTNGMLGISAYVYPGQKDVRVFLTGSIDNNTWYLQSAVYSSGGQSGQHTIQVKDERLVEGNVEGTWEANPTDTIASIQKNTTAIDENSKAIKLKADATEVNNLKGTVNSHSASINLFSDQLKSMVTESKVNDIINEKGYATKNTVQSLIDQKAGTLNESITKLSNNTATQFQSITASIDGLQTNVKNNEKDVASRFTQLASGFQSKVFDSIRQASETRTKNDAAFAKNYKTVEGAQDLNSLTNDGGYYLPGKLTNSPYKDAGDVILIVTQNFTSSKDKAGKVIKTLTGITQEVFKQGDANPYKRQATIKDKKTTWNKWSEETKGASTTITQAKDDLNFRVSDGDLISQINLAAGNALIQSGKIYLDADSVVFGKNSKAFIPSAYITNINADKITTGTLDAAKFNVKNFSADNIVGGTLSGVVVKTGANDRYFQTSKDNIYWVRKGSMSLVGNDTYLNSANGLNIADENNIQLTTWGGATVNKDGSITNLSGNSGHPKIVIDDEGKYNPDDIYGSAFGGGPGDSEIAQWVSNKEYTVLTRNQGFTVHLNDGNNKSTFAIQKDNKVGFYVGGGDDGSEIRIAGSGPIKLQGRYIDDGFNDAATHTFGNIQVDNLHVRKWLGVDQSKNAIVKTSQGSVTINAYETAEYYFGDIGEGRTGADGIVYIGIEKLFNETVNTTIPYQVFLTAYGSGNLWVAQREHDRFMVKSDQPNIKFGWEIKAKRKGYEHTRLQNVDNKLNHMEATS